MKLGKYLFALWAGVFIYTLLSFFFGAMGISAHRQLEKEQQRQEANIEHLIRIHSELEDSMNSLLYDRDTVAIHAREQGFASRHERFIRIVGLDLNQKNLTSYGELVVAEEPRYVADRTITMIALFSGLIIIICMAIFDALKYLKYNESGRV